MIVLGEMTKGILADENCWKRMGWRSREYVDKKTGINVAGFSKPYPQE
jgi:hypothetical protein